MQTEVVTVDVDVDIWTLARVLSERGITGVPVVDDKGELVGVVSQTDIIRHLKELAISAAEGQDFYEGEEAKNWGPFKTRATARELMSPEVITASETTPVETLARSMLKRRIHRVIITRGRKIAGIVTTMDLLGKPR